MVPIQPAMHCACFGFHFLWICSRMFNFKTRVNFIYCIPHIDHGSLLLKSQKNVLAHGWCWWKFCLATVHWPEQNTNKWRLNLGNFQQTYFLLFALSDFTILKCSLKCRAKSHFHCCYCSATVITRANLMKHIASVIFHWSKWINTFQLPMEALEMILLEVVLQDGDAAYMNLSLTCSCFRAIVNKARFRQKAHYAWLDSKCVKV